MQNEIKIPNEYVDVGDYGFSGVDNPEDRIPSPPAPPVIPVEVHDSLADVNKKLDQILTDIRLFAHVSADSSAPPNTEYEARIRQLETIIVPLLNNLLKTADKDYIFWPNRKDVIESMLEKVLEITRPNT